MNHHPTGYTPAVFSLATPTHTGTAAESRTNGGVHLFVDETILVCLSVSLAVRREKVALAPGQVPYQNKPCPTLVCFGYERFFLMK